MPIEVIMPNLGAASDRSTLIRWLVEEGDAVKAGQPLFEAESDKATVEIEAAAPGMVMRLLTLPGESIPAGQVVALLRSSDEAVPAQDRETVDAQAKTTVQPQPGDHSRTPEPSTNRLIITPLARKLARLEGVDISAVIGSGPHGRIVEADIRAVVEGRQHPAGNAPPPVNSIEGAVPLSTTRQVIAHRMAESVQTTARVTLTTEVNAERLVAVRKALQAGAGEQSQEFSYTLLLAWITASALIELPVMNASFTETGIVYHPQINIGIAVDTPRGLLVPVLKNVAGRTLLDLAGELESLVSRVQSGQASPGELSGGTFTITNLGMYGVDAFTPVINLPECAILGLGRIRKKPVEKDDTIVLGHTLSLSLSFDHRLTDGAPAARFLQCIARLVEAPELIFLNSVILHPPATSWQVS